MKIIIKDIIAALLIVVVIAAVIVAFIYALDKSEEVKCLKLQSQSEQYQQTFYLTVFEKEMCDYHNILINAPVQ